VLALIVPQLVLHFPATSIDKTNGDA
jgi:hypothetical protein